AGTTARSRSGRLSIAASPSWSCAKGDRSLAKERPLGCARTALRPKRSRVDLKPGRKLASSRFGPTGYREPDVNHSTAARAEGVAAGTPAHGVSLREAFWTWARVAALSFGGPAGQIAVMHRILVDESDGSPIRGSCMR